MSLANIIKKIRDDYSDDAATVESSPVAVADEKNDQTVDPRELKYKLDSLRTVLNSYNYLINLNSSMRSIDFKSLFNNAQGEKFDNFKRKYSTPTNAIRSWQFQADSLMSEMGAIENELSAYLRINKLVPVVVNERGGEHSYIFWYEPTAELIDKLPSKYRSALEPELIALKNSLLDCRVAPEPGAKSFFDVWRACSGAIENLSISPNPVKDMLTATYTLTSERSCSVALHDLRGAKVKDLSDFRNKPASEIVEQYPISGVTPGLYLLVVTSNNGEQAVQRVIVE
jgi:hypothetical protein